MRMGIRGKLVATLIITGVIPLLIAISITYFMGISQRKEIIGQSFQQLSDKARESIALTLTSNIRALRGLAALPITVDFLNSPAMTFTLPEDMVKWQIEDVERQWSALGEEDQLIKKILENQLSKTLRASRSVVGSFGEIFVTDAAGQVVAATNKTSDYWQADEDWWLQTYNHGYGQLYLSNEVSFDESAGIYSIDVCVPVKVPGDDRERVIGIIKGVLDISSISESIYRINIGEGGRGLLVSGDGTVVISSDRASLQERLPLGVCPSTSRGNLGSFIPEDGPDWLVGFARIELGEFGFSTQWLVVVYQELTYAYSPVHKLVWYIALSGAGLIIVFFFLGLYLTAGAIVSPLSLLTQTVKRVASGDLTKQVQIRSKDEIGELASSFNQMLSNLRKRASLDDISLNMLSRLELRDVLNVGMETLKISFDAAFARVWLVEAGDLCDDCIHAGICNNREQCLHLKVTVGMYAKDDEYLRVPLGSLKVGWIAENRKPFMTNDLATDTQIHHYEWLRNRLVVSFAGYPLLVGDELLGVLALFSQNPISDEDFAILGSFANRTAMAIQNARLHSEIMELNLSLEKRIAERTWDLEQANVELRKADQLKSEFLANMSHELRTPLNAIIGFAEILRDGLCGAMNEEQVASVSDIHASGKHLLQMINDILDLSKVEAGRMELQPEEFSLAEAIDNVQSIVRDMVNRGHLDLQISVPDNLPYIYADQVKFKQIMYNLLSNAVKFTPENGSITVDVSFNNDDFLVSVTDTGIGINPEDHETIFDEFRQLDSSRSRQYEGTGLGLALTKRLVELHEGRIWVESEGSGMGSKFSFTLPVAKPSIDLDHETQNTENILAKLSASIKTPGSAEKTILVVEDNPQAAQLLCIYLNEAGYDTLVATDGDEAVKMALAVKPFAITLDIMLPKKDGWQVMQELKSFPDTGDIPIIIISIVDDQSLGFSMGAVGYLVKPIDKDQLAHALGKLELAPKVDGAAPRILIIDDKPEDLNLAQIILESEGFQVLKALDGISGISKAISEHPELIILDLLMPDVSGFDVVKALREHPQARDIPIIVCTAKDLTAEDREVLNSKVKSIIQKGEDAKKRLMDAVRRIEQFHLG